MLLLNVGPTASSSVGACCPTPLLALLLAPSPAAVYVPIRVTLNEVSIGLAPPAARVPAPPSRDCQREDRNIQPLRPQELERGHRHLGIMVDSRFAVTPGTHHVREHAIEVGLGHLERPVWRDDLDSV